MCGIAGVLGAADPAQAEARAARMIAGLSHRGPDGTRVERVGNAVLAHARLSIIDLEHGRQPLHAAGSTVIGNGEIYNYVELTGQFGLADRLATGSDFEPLLHLYALEGERAFARLRGMYAFCLVGCDGRTWLVRDPFGIKPLYLARNVGERGGELWFASEPAPLWRELGTGPEVAAEQLLGLNYTVEASLGGGVERLPPGAAWCVEGGDVVESRGSSAPVAQNGDDASASPVHGGGGSVRIRSETEGVFPARLPSPGKQDPPPSLREYSPRERGERTLIQTLDSVLEDSVRVHQRSDVPYGLFLSGGIDSASIATLMARLNSRPVTAFTCGFDATGAQDERAAAERVARALDLDWRETSFGEGDFWRIAPLAAQAMDDPTSDYAILPTYKLAEAAKGTLTVVLTGEGGDELFGGYGRYRRALKPRWLGGRPAEPQVDAPFLRDGGRSALEQWRAAALPPPGLSPLQRAQAADVATWLPDDLLLKLDRCLMAHGLEGRTPFLDREVAAFAWGLPDQLKVRGRHGKWILRKWLERACPAASPWARKQGFTVPVAAWIAPRAADLGPRIAACEGVAKVCDVDAVRAAFSDSAGAKHRWPLLFYALWWTIHVGGASPAEARAAIAPAA